MGEKIVIKYTEETLDFDNLTDREKAIYNAAYSKGFERGRNKPSEIISGLSCLVIIIYMISQIIF